MGMVRTRAGDRLLDQDWYHGMLPRSEIVELLREDENWLVRATEKYGETRYVISIKWKKNIRHIMLREDKEKGGFIMASGMTEKELFNKRFPTVLELIEYHVYRKKALNDTDHLTLKRGRHVERRKWMIRDRDVTLETKIGEGAFGEVHKGWMRFRKIEVPVAIKTCKMAMTTEEREEFMKEAKLMLNYIHDNVVRFYGVAADKLPLMLVMEFCDNGSLDKHLLRHTSNRGTKVKFCMEAARGMEYLAVRKNCVHRDLAARNCLLGADREVKIADFGLANKGAVQLDDLKGAKLPVKWAAPESLLNGIFSKESDMWTFGVLMWEIFANATTPWPGKNNREAFVAMRSGEKMDIPADYRVPDEVQVLMWACWELDPKRRPAISTVRHHLENLLQANARFSQKF